MPSSAFPHSAEPPGEISDYDPAWPEQFRELAARLRTVLPERFEIEHVGSTSVAGLAAKPIIDLDVVVPEPLDVSCAIDRLARLGYRHRGDLGISGREAFTVLPGGAYHHLYLVVAGSKPHRDHIDLRDLLRRSPTHAARYAAAKRSLAPLLLTDRQAYGSAKAGIIAELLALAREQQPETSRTVQCF